jgi:putative transcriptional regulator
VGERLRRLRLERLLTQKDLADLAGVRQQTISDTESGRRMPRVSTLRKLAGALEVAPKDLLGTLPPVD